jgi:hypothetical protein
VSAAATPVQPRWPSVGTMHRSDRLLSRLVLGTLAPVVLFLAGWWGTLGLLGDSPVIGPAALGGLALGALALFYSVMIYGFFMGFPVANLLVGLVAGHVVGRRARLHSLPAEQAARESRLALVFVTSILTVLCVATAWMALNQRSIESEVRHMLGLPFEVTRPMIYATIVVGGAGLLAAQYAATVLATRRASRLDSR